MMRALVVVCLLGGLAYAEDKPTITLADLPELAIGPIDVARIAELEKEPDLNDAALLFEYATQLGNRARGLRERDPNTAKGFLIKSVKAYRTLVDNDKFRHFASRDAALFGYGLVLQSFNYMQEAGAVYNKLLTTYPSSSFAPIVRVVISDHVYDQNKLEDAQRGYEAVLKDSTSPSQSPTHSYAAYKLGWVHYQNKRYIEAVFYFTRATDPKVVDNVRAAARQAFVMTFVHLGKADKAVQAFARIDANEWPAMSMQLALRFEQSGRLDLASVVYRNLVAREPENANACTWHSELVRLAAALPDKVAAAEALVAYEAKHPADACHAQAVQIAGDVAKLELDQLATQPNPALANRAARLLAVYVAEHPNTGDTQTLETVAQEAWQRAQADPSKLDAWADAAVAFDALATATQTPTAAVKASRAWRNALGNPSVAAPEVKLTKRKPPEAQPVPQREQELLEMLDDFVATLGDDHEVGQLRLIAAVTYRKYHQHDKALAILGVMMQTDVAETAALMLLDSLATTRQLDQLQREIADMIGAPKFLDDKPKLMATIARLRKR